MKKFKAILIMALSSLLASALSGCQPNPDEELMYALIEEFAQMTGEDAVILNDEYSEKLDEMCRNIQINNSRFALPMKISDLPGEFTVKFSEDEPETIAGKFITQTAGIYLGDERYCEIIILGRENNVLDDGIIVAITVKTSECKISIGDFYPTRSPEEIKALLGEPSIEHVLSDDVTAWIYISKNNGFLLTSSSGGAFMAYHA